MAFVYEINGQRVEFEKEPTEADIDEAAKSLGPAETEKTATAGDVALQAAQALAPAGMYGATGFDELGQAVRAGASPYMNASGEALKKTAQIYKAMPIVAPAIDVAGTALFGAPPIALGQQAMGALDKYTAIKEGAKGVSQELSKGKQTKDAYNAMKRALYKNDPTGFRDVLRTEHGPFPGGDKAAGAGNNAVRSALSSSQAQAAMAANPGFAQAAQAYLKTVPTVGQQAMKVVAPFARGAMKVAGPAGMAMNVYDAGQMARETELGQRLQQGQGQQAEAAFRNLNTQYGSAMTPQEAQTVMSSGNKRDIAAFGGEDRLKQLIRQKAAARILGQ